MIRKKKLLSKTHGLKQEKLGKDRDTSVRRIESVIHINLRCHGRQQSLENVMG